MKLSFRARLSTVGALVVIVTCGIAVTYFYWPIHALLFEIEALTALFLLFRSTPPVVRWLKGLPVVHRTVFCVLLVAVVAGHFTFSSRRYFPFTAWEIFAAVQEQDTVFCRELIGTTADGKSVRLLVEQLFPSIVQFDLPPQDESQAMSRLVTVVAGAYNARHASDPVREVDLMCMAVKLHPPARQSNRQPSCKFLHRYVISSAPSN